jgi:hypothetical protein
MEFNRLPFDIFSRICDTASLQDVVMLSATSVSMRQAISNIITNKKVALEKTFNDLVLSYYFNLHKRRHDDMDVGESINQSIRLFIGDAEILEITDDGILIPDSFTNMHYGDLLTQFDIGYIYDVFTYFVNGEKSSIVFSTDSEYCGEVISIIDSESFPTNNELESMINLCKVMDACL